MLVCVLFVYLVYTIEKAIYEKIFIENIKSNRVKKQNVEKFFFTLIDMVSNYANDSKNMLLVAVKLLNSKSKTCNIKVSQLFRNRELKPEEETNILYDFLILQTESYLEQYNNINILKVIRCHLLFKINQKILAIHDIVELEHEKLSFAEEFMIYQFKNNYNIFSENYEKEIY